MKKTKTLAIAFTLYMIIAPFLPSLREEPGMGCFAQSCQWAKNIGSTNMDRGNSIAVDDSGNVYIAGYFSGTADFDPGAGREVNALNDYSCFTTNLYL